MLAVRGVLASCALWALAACSDDDGPVRFIVPGAKDAGTSAVAGAAAGAGASAFAGGSPSATAGQGAAGSSGRGGASAAGRSGAGGSCSETPAGLSFVADIAPLLASRCTDCHDSGGSGGLDLRNYAGLLAGGDHGPAIVPGNCAQSVLWQKTGPMPPFGGRMPAEGGPLSEAQRAELCAWIDSGAPERAAATNCPDPMPCMAGNCPADAGSGGDTTPPDFEGIDDIDEEESSCVLSWEAASDDQSAEGAIRYEVFVREEDGAFDTDPTAVTDPGATSFTIELEEGRDYEIQVFAVDEAGNRDDNDRIRSCSLR